MISQKSRHSPMASNVQCFPSLSFSVNHFFFTTKLLYFFCCFIVKLKDAGWRQDQWSPDPQVNRIQQPSWSCYLNWISIFQWKLFLLIDNKFNLPRYIHPINLFARHYWCISWFLFLSRYLNCIFIFLYRCFYLSIFYKCFLVINRIYRVSKKLWFVVRAYFRG